MAEIAFVQEEETSISILDMYNHLFNELSNTLEEEEDTRFSLDLHRDLVLRIESLDDDYGFGFSSADCDDDFFSSNGFGSDFDENALAIELGVDLSLDFRGQNDEDLGWEEVDGMVDEREFMNADVDDDVDFSEFSAIMEEDFGMEQVSNLEWEMLLNIHNLDPNVDNDFEMLAGQFAWEEGRNLPASRVVVENLKMVVVTTEDVDGDNAMCVVCKEDMVVGEKAKSLPCLHRYHGCCIEPWLGMRNTCPICRYELPTDDLEYERRRGERGLRR